MQIRIPKPPNKRQIQLNNEENKCMALLTFASASHKTRSLHLKIIPQSRPILFYSVGALFLKRSFHFLSHSYSTDGIHAGVAVF